METEMENQLNQNQDHHRQKIKTISGILALIIGISGFGTWYLIAVDTYPEVPKYAERIHYYSCYIVGCLTFLALSINAKTRAKQLIYYAGCNFYLFLTIIYLLNWALDIVIKQNKLVIILILTCLSCVVYYLITLKRS
jgi:hypothetical protein